jgi:RNA recognition motif-containing protein
MTDAELKTLFSKYGDIKSIKVKKPPTMSQFPTAPSTSFGIAYIDFSSEDAAMKAISELNGYQVGMHALQVDYY